MEGPDPTPLVIGHRGASGYRPEHSASAYRLAFELGADAVEPDIVATRDGVLVVRHENEISGTTDVAAHAEFADRRTTKTVDGVRITGWFTEDFTWAELSTLRCRERLPKLRPENRAYDGSEPMLRLRDVLAIVDEQSALLGRPLRAVVEIKHAHYFAGLGIDLGALLLEELAATGWDSRPDRLVIESFELGVLDRLRAAAVRARLVFLTEYVGLPADEPVASPSAAVPGGRAAPGGAAVSGAGRSTTPRSYPWYRSNAGLDLLASRVDGISVAKGSLIAVNALGRAVGPTDLAGRAHERGLLVYTWTLRPENRFLNLRFQTPRAGGVLRPGEWGDWRAEFGIVLAAGVDGIFVDHPDFGVEARAAYAAGGV
ncbi:MAG: glycerophosphodiester phosphodiesterase family protein [Leucobacter sp.]